MRILVVGGTRFVGRHLVAAAIARGHEVTVLHRGVDCSGAPGARHLHADRDGDLQVLAEGPGWEATIDTCAYLPRQVSALSRALGERAGRYVLISTVSVYADVPEPGLDEQAPLVAPLGLDGSAPAIDVYTYGRLKVGCEQVAQQCWAGALLVVRPTYVLGPWDPTSRFPTWVARMARGGQVVCPGDPSAPMQYVDARDLGAFVVAEVESGDDGTVNVVAPEPPYSMGEFLATVRDAVAPVGATLHWLPSAFLVEHGVGPADLPLWTGSDDAEFALAMDPARALAAGFRARPLADTARDVARWLDEPAGQRGSGGGLPAAREQALLSAWSSR